jgi:hypothetical protein
MVMNENVMNKEKRDSNFLIEELKKIVSFFCLVYVLITYRIFINHRDFPLLPFIDGINDIPVFLNFILFAALVIFLIFIYQKEDNKVYLSFFFLIYFVLLFYDANRIQPFLFTYLSFFLFYYFYKLGWINSKFTIYVCKLIFVFAYFFSGFNKFNQSFFSYGYIRFVEPLQELIPKDFYNIIKSLGLIVAGFEFFIGFGLFFRATRKFTFYLAIILHLLIIYFIGYLHNGFATVVIYNVFCMIMIYYLFKNDNQNLWVETKQYSKKLLFHLSLILFFVLPMFNYFGYGVDLISYDLYTGNYRFCFVVMKNSVREKLPASLKQYCIASTYKDYSIFYTDYFIYHETKAVLYRETWAFIRIKKLFDPYKQKKGDVIMVVFRNGEREYYF